MRTPYLGRVLTGPILLMLGGCCAPYPNYPYGGGGYVAPPGTVVPPTIVTPPAGTLGPGSTTPPGNLGPGTPSSGNGGQSRNWPQVPKTADGASSYDSSRGNGDKPVPDYRDPNQPTAPNPRNPASKKEASPFEDSSGTSTDSTRHRDVAAESGHAPSALAHGSEQGFQPPIYQPADSRPSPSADSESASSQPNPYDHDQTSYHWLRGVVDFDAKDKSWYIIYDTAPDRSDKYGGGFTLTGGDQFSRLQDRDVVLVEGQIDFDHHDRSGKPVYRVDRLHRLVPQTRVSRAHGTAGAASTPRRATGASRVSDGVVGSLDR